MNPYMSEEMELFMVIHALNSAFDRVLESINLLAAKNALSPELAQTSNAYIETVHDHIKVELRKTLGDTNSTNFTQFSSNLSEMQSQLIAECLTEEQARCAPGRKHELPFPNVDKFRQRKTEDA